MTFKLKVNPFPQYHDYLVWNWDDWDNTEKIPLSPGVGKYEARHGYFHPIGIGFLF